MPHLRLAALVLAFAAPPAAAQTERYELGRRLRAFEAAWEPATPEARAASLADLPKVTAQFFRFQFGEAGRTLDAARHRLATPAGGATAFADSLAVVPETRLLDAAAATLPVTVKAFYAVDAPGDVALSARLKLGDGVAVDVPLGKLPATAAVPVPRTTAAADVRLVCEVRRGDETVAAWAGTVSVVPGLAKRLAALPKAAEPTTIEAATLQEHTSRLAALAEGTVAETDVPAARLLTEAEALAALPKDGRFFTADRPGDFWLSVPVPPRTPKGRFGSAAVRVFVPPKLDPAKPVPLVVALHGAGGSENLFFEGYGAGHLVKECERRGWLLVAPRAGLLGAAPVADILTALASRYPVEPKSVFLVGHSMGAGQAAEVAQQLPGSFRAVALLGGAARVRDGKLFADLPLFVGVGTKDDLALSGSRALAKKLAEAGAKRLTYREYDGVEHLTVVRTALPDVFAAWDAELGR